MRTYAPIKHLTTLLIAMICAVSCMEYGAHTEENFNATEPMLLIGNEGNFSWDNASLSAYNPRTKKVENEVFIRANAMKLGDVVQSITLHNNRAYIVVNNSGVVYVVDPLSFRITGLIEDVVSPRYIHFPNDTTAYITDLYDSRITVIDTRTNAIQMRIDVGEHRSTEQMTQWGDDVFVNCWSYDDKILIIDSRTNTLTGSIEVGWQPSSMAIDRRGKLWVTTDGREGEMPAITRIDAATRTIERRFKLPQNTIPRSATLNSRRDTLYYIAEDVWRMPTTSESLPATPFRRHTDTKFYSIAVEPVTSEVYIADAIDYVQYGVVYRTSPEGEDIDTLRVGVIPSAFCFKP